MKEVIENLNRNVKINSGKIELNTDSIDGLSVAYYLYHKNGVEKVSYNSNKSCTFSIPIENGYYKGVFFYKYSFKEKINFSVEFVINDFSIININKETIAEDINWKIDYYNINSYTTFVVFNTAGSNKNSIPFGLNFLLNRGFNVIACLTGLNNFYQDLSFNTFKEIVLPFVKDKIVFCYGSSLGAYCSVYYAGAINATVIASAPLNPIHPCLVKMENFKNIYKHVDIINNKLTNKEVYIFVDPHVKQDTYFFDNVIKNAYPLVKLLNCNYAGHEVLHYLNDTKQLSSIIDTIVSGQVPNIHDNLESKYTDIGKAKYYIKLRDGEKALFFATKALNYSKLNEKLRLRFQTVLNQAENLFNAGVFLKNSTNDLSRYIYISDGKIKFETEESIQKFLYAFYLYHKNGVEKVFYTNLPFCIFNIPLNIGNYEAVFFYRNVEKQNVFYKIKFLIDDSFKIIIEK